MCAKLIKPNLDQYFDRDIVIKKILVELCGLKIKKLF